VRDSTRLRHATAALRTKLEDDLFELRVLREAGIIGGMRPDRAVRAGATFVRWGASPATGATNAAIHHPHEPALIDERGALTFDQVHRRTNALARSLARIGIAQGDGVGVMCRNHRGFVEATLAAAKLGASVLYLNTSFAGPQLVDVVARERPKALVYDEEFAGLLEGVDPGVMRIVAWSERAPGAGAGAAGPDAGAAGPDAGAGGAGSGGAAGAAGTGGAAGATGEERTLEGLIADSGDANLKPPAEKPRFVILTSGTTGTPKGAQRSSPNGLFGLAALIDKIPFRSRETMVIAAPLFHSWGFFHFILSLPTASTIVLHRRFDPVQTLRAVQRHRAQVLVAVPVMIQRILALEEETLAGLDLSSLRITSLSGSALPGELAIAWMDRFGENIYNLYGSTEVSYATVATPQDLRAAPGTAGRPPRGTVVRLYDERGHEVPRGEVGRIFAGNEMSFEGYTGGGNKEVIDGLMSTGDTGHLDDHGRLFVDGRDDEMIVSGGENVFPREVEDLLHDHVEIDDAAVVGVRDPEWGQRLKAFVVPHAGSSLDAEEVQAYVKANLARYKVPREVVFIDELPRNATGKVLKRELIASD